MKKFGHFNLVILSIIMLIYLLPTSSLSQNKKYTISGFAKDKNSTAISEVAIYLSGGKAERILTDASGFYKFENLDSGKSYKVTPIKQGYTFDPETKVFEKLNENKSLNFTGTTIPNFTISGYVKDAAGKGIKGVAINIVSVLTVVKKVETDSTGFYKFDNLLGGKSFTLLPAKTGFTFDPKSVTIENLNENKVVDFRAIPPATYSISGTVKTGNGVPIGGVTVIQTGERSAKIITDSITGAYKFENLLGGKTYVVTIYKAGITFEPRTKTFENLNENKTQNFIGLVAQKYSITGTVKDKDSKPVGGVLMSLVGGSMVSNVVKSLRTTTDSVTGSYKFENLETGTYTLIPEKKNYTFTPKTKTFENLNQNQVQDFKAEGLPFYSISGYVKDKSGSPIPEVTVVLLGAVQLKAVTDKNTGFYKFEKLPGGRYYTLYALKRGYTFDPRTKTIENLNKDQTVDFTGIAAQLLTLSGYIKDKSGLPILNATVRLTGEKHGKDTVDQKGYYQFENLEAGRNYVLIPEAKGYLFDPRVKSFEPLNESKTQDFVGAGVPLYNIDGYVKDSAGNAIQGVKFSIVGGSSASSESDNNGYYKFEKLSAGKYYLLVPSKRGMIFTPKYKMIENLSDNVSQDFTGKNITANIPGVNFNSPLMVTGVLNVGQITDAPTYSIIGIVQDINSSFISNVTIYLNGTDQKVTQTDDNGIFTFDDLSEGGTYSIIPSKSGFIFDPNSITYTELSDNIAEMILGENMVTTSVKGNSILPKELSLYQNYPNPFNPSTIIKFDLVESGNINLKVYDIMGREVTTIYSGYQTAGTHKMKFDAKNFSSGKYFIRLQSGNKSKTINVLLLK